MLKFLKKLIKSEDGQSVIELAITLPILLMVLCAIIDFGWLFTNQLTISYCSREGARYAIVNPTSITNIQNRVTSIAPPNIRDTITVNVTFSNPTVRRNGDVTVEVLGNIKVLTPITGVFTHNESIEISSKCVMKVE